MDLQKRNSELKPVNHYLGAKFLGLCNSITWEELTPWMYWKFEFQSTKLKN
jgi:hypothetical protein